MFADGSVYACELGEAGNGLITSTGDVSLLTGSTLVMQATGFFGTGPYAAVAADRSLPVPDTNESMTVADSPSAADPVLDQVFEQELASLEQSLGELAWLREFEMSTRDRPSDEDKSVQEAVDDLLATYWT